MRRNHFGQLCCQSLGNVRQRPQRVHCHDMWYFTFGLEMIESIPNTIVLPDGLDGLVEYLAITSIRDGGGGGGPPGHDLLRVLV